MATIVYLVYTTQVNSTFRGQETNPALWLVTRGFTRWSLE